MYTNAQAVLPLLKALLEVLLCCRCVTYCCVLLHFFSGCKIMACKPNAESSEKLKDCTVQDLENTVAMDSCSLFCQLKLWRRGGGVTKHAVTNFLHTHTHTSQTYLSECSEPICMRWQFHLLVVYYTPIWCHTHGNFGYIPRHWWLAAALLILYRSSIIFTSVVPFIHSLEFKSFISINHSDLYEFPLLISLICKGTWWLPTVQTEKLQWALLTHFHSTANCGILTCLNLTSTCSTCGIQSTPASPTLLTLKGSMVFLICLNSSTFWSSNIIPTTEILMKT